MAQMVQKAVPIGIEQVDAHRRLFRVQVENYVAQSPESRRVRIDFVGIRGE